MIIIYGIILGISILFLLGYCLLVKNKEHWMILLFFSVAVANAGYLFEAVATTKPFAIFANDLAYLGAISVMLSTLMSVIKLCGFTPSKPLTVVLVCLCVVMFAIVALHPVLPLYYHSTWIETLNGVTMLKKNYGPLYPLYFAYIVAYLVAMVATIIVSLVKRRIFSNKIAALLFVVALINCIVWRAQRTFDLSFNLLSVSYILGASILLYLFWLMHDYVHKKNIAQPDPIVIEKIVYVAKDFDESGLPFSREQVDRVLSSLKPNNRLTDTERKVLFMLLSDYSRKEISVNLSISENTVKSHISHIYTKLGVRSKDDLRSLFG